MSADTKPSPPEPEVMETTGKVIDLMVALKNALRDTDINHAAQPHNGEKMNNDDKQSAASVVLMQAQADNLSAQTRLLLAQAEQLEISIRRENQKDNAK